MPDLDSLPTYAQLLERSDAPAGSNWGLFGKDDQLGRGGGPPEPALERSEGPGVWGACPEPVKGCPQFQQPIWARGWEE